MEKPLDTENHENLPNEAGEHESDHLDGEESALQRHEHKEAVAFVERHRDFFEHYARGRLHIEPAPAGETTFATDLETDTIYINSMFYKDLHLSDEKTSFATLHEIEHFLEKMDMISEEDGTQRFRRYLDKIKNSEAYSHMDNCVADIRENQAVVSKTNQEFRQVEVDAYRENLFKDTDFRAEPKHIQFCNALLRESRVLDERCQVAEDVRKKLDDLGSVKNSAGRGLLEVITNPELPMSLRVRLQDRFIWPIVDELLKKDIEEQKDKKKNKSSKEGGKNDKQNKRKEKVKKAGKKADDKNENSQDKASVDEGLEDEEVKPNDLFKEAYDKVKKHLPHAMPVEEIEKILEKVEKERRENPEEKADKEYAEKIGVTKGELQKYRSIVKKLNEIKNPETNQSVIEELRELIERIIAERLRISYSPKYPVEEGEDLVDPTELVAQFKAGNLLPKVWETYEFKEGRGKQFGEVEITLICDRSSSMESGSKLREQQKAAVLLMEALKEFSDMAEDEKLRMTKPLEIRSEIYTFQASGADSAPVKRMSKELGEKERIDVFGLLNSAPGGNTTDYVSLESIAGNIKEETFKKIKEGEIKKIVIVFTDGESGNIERVKKSLADLRSKGIVVVGVGITEEGSSVLETYAPRAEVARKAEDLAVVLGNLLKKELAGLNG